MTDQDNRTKYSVHKANGQNRVVIALADFGPAENQGFTEVGTFSLAEGTTLNGENGDHILITKAKEVLRDSSDERFSGLDLDKLTYLDQSSNAPVNARREQLTGGTDQLPTSTGETDPEDSSQAGGEGNTGLPKDQLEPNGVTPTEEAAEAGVRTDDPDTHPDTDGETDDGVAESSETRVGTEANDETESENTEDAEDEIKPVEEMTSKELVDNHTKDQLLELAKDIDGVRTDNNKDEIADKIVAARKS